MSNQSRMDYFDTILNRDGLYPYATQILETCERSKMSIVEQVGDGLMFGYVSRRHGRENWVFFSAF